MGKLKGLWFLGVRKGGDYEQRIYFVSVCLCLTFIEKNVSFNGKNSIRLSNLTFFIFKKKCKTNKMAVTTSEYSMSLHNDTMY